MHADSTDYCNPAHGMIEEVEEPRNANERTAITSASHLSEAVSRKRYRLEAACRSGYLKDVRDLVLFFKIKFAGYDLGVLLRDAFRASVEHNKPGILLYLFEIIPGHFPREMAMHRTNKPSIFLISLDYGWHIHESSDILTSPPSGYELNFRYF